MFFFFFNNSTLAGLLMFTQNFGSFNNSIVKYWMLNMTLRDGRLEKLLQKLDSSITTIIYVPVKQTT